MIIFKSKNDLAKLPVSHPAFHIVQRHLDQIADLYPHDGYLILVEAEDTQRDLKLPELGRPWTEIQWEGVISKEGYFHAVYLTNNEFALDFLIPDTKEIGRELRLALKEHATG